MQSNRTIARICPICGKEFAAAFRYTNIRRYCSRKCAYRRRYDEKPWESQFWSSVDRSGECWLWIGKRRNRKGYGVIYVEGKEWLAHRLSWVIRHGDIPECLQVLHNCPSGDNPACVNPDHLFLGTKSDNTKDMWAKNRGVKPPLSPWPKGCPRPGQTGERHVQSKLTDEAVREIRKSYRPRKVSMQRLADKFGVSRTAVAFVIRGHTWSSVME